MVGEIISLRNGKRKHIANVKDNLDFCKKMKFYIRWNKHVEDFMYTEFKTHLCYDAYEMATEVYGLEKRR